MFERPAMPAMSERNWAALLVTASGLWQITGLWRYRLTEETLLTALTGSIYLLMAIGLFGRSRFTLFLAIVVCGTFTLLGLSQTGLWSWPPLALLRTGTDLLATVLCARVLWTLRHAASF
ncbi:hypothetical protein [Kineobactrum salinum]|uniref:Uncharacterized protein n=1 Tax=Kineobactrum salinum TaxID=2708301 RepID=A0A6C0U978_9GAMM|nr:hypothetical protein [Kineobactrum salinum]QIB66174.1 hypothetical protein G3T16_12885 [Kineobactrum salinum]